MKRGDANYPEPASLSVSAAMKGNRRVDTRPEVRLRSALHRKGLRFRKDILVHTSTKNCRPDIVFTKKKIAVYVDGCFWQGCPVHGNSPKRSTGYWGPKVERTKNRDLADNLALLDNGWTVIRLWEHDTLEESLDMILPQIDRDRIPVKEVIKAAVTNKYT